MSSTTTTARHATGLRPAYFLGRPSRVYTARYASAAPVTQLRPSTVTARAA
jgi:hypothetical protein